MKMKTIIERNSDKGFFPALVIDSSSHDYAIRAAVGILGTAELLTAVARAMQKAGDDTQDMGDVTVEAFGYDVLLQREVAECVALYGADDPRVDGLVGLVCLTLSSNFRQARMDVCRQVEFGAYEQVTPYEMPLPIVDPIEFAAACREAISAGRASMPRRIPETGDGSVPHCVYQRSWLSDYSLDVTVSGVTRQIRLDLAMALVKREDRLPADAYGDVLVGATYPLQGKNANRWHLTYVIPEGRRIPRPHMANIDHVVPQSAGGRTRLCNLQFMRAAANARKASEILVDISGEPARSARVVMSLARGLRTAHEAGELDDALYASLMSICKRELTACAEFIEGHGGVKHDA